VHIISCLKLQHLAAKYISSARGVGGVDIPCRLRLSLTPTPALQIASHQVSSQKYQPCCLCWGLHKVISASLLFVLQKSFSVPAVIVRNWQVDFC